MGMTLEERIARIEEELFGYPGPPRTVTLAHVKRLRVATGAGMMDCKQAALRFPDNDVKAIDWIRRKGQC